MKRIIIIAFAVMLGTLIADTAFPLMSIEEVEENYLQDYELVKTIKLEGQGHSSAVAKDSGDIVVMTEEENFFLLYYFDIYGNLKWTKDFKKGKSSYFLEISDNGSVVLIQNIWDHNTDSYVYDSSGIELFNKHLINSQLVLSPEGKYLYLNFGVMTNNQKDIKLFDLNGNSIGLPVELSKNVEDIRIHFIDNKKLLVILKESKNAEFESRLVCISYADEIFEKLWERPLSITFMGALVNRIFSSYNNLTGIGSNGNEFFVIDNDTGNKIFEYSSMTTNWGWTQSGEIIINDTRNLTLLESNKDGKYKSKSLGKRIDHNAIKDVIEISKNFFINFYRLPMNHKKFNSVLLSKGNKFYIEESFHFINSENYSNIALINLLSNCNISVYKEK